MQDLIQARNQTLESLHAELENYRRAGLKLAENEREYRMALAVDLASKRAAGVPVTVLGDLSRGEPHVAELKAQRDSSEAVYKASLAYTQTLKKELEIIEADIDREYRGGGYGA